MPNLVVSLAEKISPRNITFGLKTAVSVTSGIVPKVSCRLDVRSLGKLVWVLEGQKNDGQRAAREQAVL